MSNSSYTQTNVSGGTGNNGTTTNGSSTGSNASATVNGYSMTTSRYGSKCGNWDFVANSANQLTLSQALMDAANNFDTRKNDMYGKIGEMGTYWKGDDYDAFNNSTKSYDPALLDFSDGIRMFGTQFETIAANTDILAADLVGIVQNITKV